MSNFIENDLEQAAGVVSSLGYQTQYGPDISPEEVFQREKVLEMLFCTTGYIVH